MARLIDADALKDSFCAACATNKRYQRTNEDCRSRRDSYGNGCFKMRLIDSAPTVDGVEVVRCKDCIHFQKNQFTDHGGYCNYFGYYDYEPKVNSNGYCSCGEKRE